MAQRVLIAGAVSCNPDLLIADEPTTALDVTVQAEVLDLLRDLQEELHMGVLLVTHNFGVVADLCDRVSVMRNGRIVETGPARSIFAGPQHAYTQALFDAILEDSEPRGALPLPAPRRRPRPPARSAAPTKEPLDERPPARRRRPRRRIPGQGLPGQALPGAARASRSTSCPARPWAWSASPGRARPRSAGPSSASPRSPAGTIGFEGRDISHLPESERRALSSDIRWSSRTPTPRSTRR